VVIAKHSPKQKAVCLLSRGFDSPIAAYLVEKQGLEVIGVHFDNYPLIKSNQKKYNNTIIEHGKIDLEKISRKLLTIFSQQKKLVTYIIPHGNDLQILMEKSQNRHLTCILCKRLMLRKAAIIASKIDSELIVTGEILGEQASQTIDNLPLISSVLKDKYLIRPLLAMNKQEVIDLAHAIGTYPVNESLANVECQAVPKNQLSVLN
jgi:thiamine biosynthesis protein ThiI